jgi:hypothetical protein
LNEGFCLEQWSTFATVAGGAAAGLTGLLFVAVSIRIGVIVKSQELRNRAAQTLALFVTVLFVAILLSIPEQSLLVLGIEVLALAVIIGVAMLALDRRARAESSERDDTARNVASILDAVAPNMVTSGRVTKAGYTRPCGHNHHTIVDAFLCGKDRATRPDAIVDIVRVKVLEDGTEEYEEPTDP